MTEAGIHHLSIGEVLGILLEEFPDITISKIRFLESQGLINPERTPSGYRKFYDDDVELLRVILREQRENFLPLRVIKDRLDSGEITPSKGIAQPGGSYSDHSNDPTRPVSRGLLADPLVGGAGGTRVPAASRAPDGALEPASVTGHASSSAAAPGASSASPAPPSATPSAHADATAGTTRPAPSTPANTVVTTAASSASTARHPSTSSPGDDMPTDDDVASHPSAGGRRPRSRRATDATGATERPAADGPTARRAAPAHAAELAPDATGAIAPVANRPLPGTVVHRDELCAMAKITPDELAKLIEFGVLRQRAGSPADIFADEAVEIAAAAAALMRAGLDMRNLRAWRTSVEREAGLFEQIIMPTLRQRHPQARSAATDQLGALVTAAAGLRAAMMRSELSHLRS